MIRMNVGFPVATSATGRMNKETSVCLSPEISGGGTFSGIVLGRDTRRPTSIAWGLWRERKRTRDFSLLPWMHVEVRSKAQRLHGVCRPDEGRQLLVRKLKCGSLTGLKGTATFEGFHSNGWSSGNTEHQPPEKQHTVNQWRPSEEQRNGDPNRKRSGLLPPLAVTSISESLPGLSHLPLKVLNQVDS